MFVVAGFYIVQNRGHIWGNCTHRQGEDIYGRVPFGQYFKVLPYFLQVSRVLTYMGTWGQPVGKIWSNFQPISPSGRRVIAVLLFCTENIAKTSPKHCQNITKTLPKHRQNIAKTSPKHRQNITKTSPKYRQNIAKTSPTHHQNIAKTLPKHRQNITKTGLLNRPIEYAYWMSLLNGPIEWAYWKGLLNMPIE